jgi:pimeloyl-ACP methyl ester carboxylesterase
MTSVAANGLQFEVESFGDPADPAVLLIMGLGMQLTAWPEPFCRRIADAGYRVLRFDNRDIGLSSKIATTMRPNVPLEAMRYLLRLPVRAPYRIADMADDARGVLDALGIDRAHLAGVSMGGMIAQNLAASTPSRCISLTSIMSSSGARHLPLAKPRVLRLMLSRPPRQAPLEQLVAHYARLFRALGGPGFANPDAELRERLMLSVQRCHHPAGTLRQLLAVVASGDRSDLLGRIEAPTLVIHGDADPLLPLPHGQDCARKIRGATFESIAGMGHDLPSSLVPVLADKLIGHLQRNRTPPM